MPSTVASVMIASASAVAKVYIIGAVGYFAVKRPKVNPLIPAKSVGTIARMSFNLLLLPLIYSTIGSTVSTEVLGSLWSIPLSAVVVIMTSYLTATALGYLPCFRLDNPVDFDALRIAASFPNIVALPILIFPALCEYEVVYEAFSELGPDATSSEMFRDCVAKSNTMIFLYFFAWSFLFWVFGNQKLIAAARSRQSQEKRSSQATGVTVEGTDADLESDSAVPTGPAPQHTDRRGSRLGVVWVGIKHTVTSPGFIAMILGFVTGCIPPLQSALFSPGGSLRFFGSAMETLGRASSPLSTIVVAASLRLGVHVGADRTEVAEAPHVGADTTEVEEAPHVSADTTGAAEVLPSQLSGDNDDADKHEGVAIGTSTGSRLDSASPSPDASVPGTESPIMSDPNFGPHRPTIHRRSSLRNVGAAVRRRSSRLVTAIHRSPSMRMHVWFIASRLVVAPAIVFAVLVGLDCGGVLGRVPDLAKLVVMVNAAVPGALTVVVILKSEGLSESASVVAKVYFPSYILSIVTIAGWTAVGLLISIPGDEGASLCA